MWAPPNATRSLILNAAIRPKNEFIAILNRGFVLLTRADSYCSFDAGDKNLAIANFAGACGANDGIDTAVNVSGFHHHFNFYFR